MPAKREHIAAFVKLREENEKQAESLRSLKATISGPAMTPRVLISSQTETPPNGPIELILKTRRNWNQEFQALCAAPVGGDSSPAAARRHSLHSLWSSSQPISNSAQAPLSSRSTASTMSSMSSADVMQKIKRLNSFIEDFNAHMLTLGRSALDDYIGEEPAVPVEIAQDSDTSGLRVRVTLYDFEDRRAVSRIGKDISAQYRVLSQQLAFLAEPLVCVPLRTVVKYKGRLMTVTSLADQVPSKLILSHQCVEMQIVMDMLTETLNLSPYYASVDGKGKPERLTGPFKATCFRAGDGRLYFNDVCGLYPHFPPPRAGALDPAQHTVLLRHELVESTFVSIPLSPAAFCVFGTQDSANHNINVRETARIACQVAVANLAARFRDNCPDSLADLVDLMHSNGVNLASLGIFLFYLERGSPAYSLILTEMVARGMRVLLLRLMSEQIETEEIHEAVQGCIAQINNPATSQEYFAGEILPILRENFMGLSSLLSDPKLALTKAPTADCINTKLLLGRLSVLVGVRFKDGVDENGMSPFHYPIAELLPVGKESLKLPVPFCAKTPFPSLDVACTPKGTAAVDGLGTRHQLEQRPGASFAIERYLMTRERQLTAIKATDATRAALAHMYVMYDLSSHLNRYHKLPERSAAFVDSAISEFDALFKALPHNADTYVFGGQILFEKAKASMLVGPSSREDTTSHSLWVEGVLSDLRAAMHFYAPELNLSDDHNDDPLIAGGKSLSLSNPLGECASVYGLAVGRELVAALSGSGSPKATVPVLEWMVRASTQIHGDLDTITMGLQAQLGVACYRTGAFVEAEKQLRAVLAANEITKRPEDSSTVGTTLNALACLLSQTNRNEESIQFFTRDVELCVGTNGPAHPSVSQARSSLGAAYLKCNDHVRAEKEMMGALDGLRNTYGQTPHPDVADALVNVGALRSQQRRMSDAEAHFLEAVSALNASEGDSSHRLIAPYEHLERIAQQRGDAGKQSLYFSRAKSVRDANGSSHANEKNIQVLPPTPA